MSEATFGVIIGASGAAISIMFGIVLRNVGKLADRFDNFTDGCRQRHEGVITKEDYLREHVPLENKVDALHSRLDKHEAREEASHDEIDRR